MRFFLTMIGAAAGVFLAAFGLSYFVGTGALAPPTNHTMHALLASSYLILAEMPSPPAFVDLYMGTIWKILVSVGIVFVAGMVLIDLLNRRQSQRPRQEAPDRPPRYGFTAMIAVHRFESREAAINFGHEIVGQINDDSFTDCAEFLGVEEVREGRGTAAEPFLSSNSDVGNEREAQVADQLLGDEIDRTHLEERLKGADLGLGNSSVLCSFCGEPEYGCFGGGLESEVPAHDFTPNKPVAEEDDIPF